jgi:two-component system nitrogen regulation response regulator NtrX
LLHAADGGTLLLDELCEMHLSIQAKLLRALEEGSVRRLGGRRPIPFDVRFIAATNQDIQAAVRAGRFRRDLFFRIHVIEIQVPPLAERREDVPLLAVHFLQKTASAWPGGIQGVEPAALETLTRYDWPGNVRELRNTVERMAILTPANQITIESIPLEIRLPPSPPAPGLHAVRDAAERERIVEALEQTNWNVSGAARILGVERTNLHKRIRALGLSRD